MNGIINFFFEETAEIDLSERKITQWVNEICKRNDATLSDVNYIICSDDHLLSINQEYLEHDFYTDIITFDNSEKEGVIEGDIFLSVDRIKENAMSMGVTFDNELLRVFAHGILHLIGYGDKSEQEIRVMRKKEDECLSLFPE